MVWACDAKCEECVACRRTKSFLDNPVSWLYPEIIINNIRLVVVLSYIIKLCCKDLNKLIVTDGKTQLIFPLPCEHKS